MSKFAIAFMLSNLVGWCAALFVDLSWGVYLYQLNYFLNPVIRWWYQSVPDLRYSFIVALVLLVGFIYKRSEYPGSVFVLPVTKWLILMIGMMSIMNFYAVWPAMHWRFYTAFLKQLLFLLIAFKVINTPEKFEWMIRIFLVGNFYVAWTAHGMGRIGGERLSGIGMADSASDNDMAAVLVTAVPVLLFYILKGRTWQRWTSLLFLAFILDAIILINSRGAIVGLSVCMVYLFARFLFERSINAKMKFIAIGSLSFGITLFIYLTDATFWNRMMTLQEVSEGGGGSGRTMFWMKAFELVKKHPFGVGVWGYQYLSPQFLPEEVLTEGMRAVHSTYFQVFTEYGYAGVFMFGGLLFSNFRMIRKINQFLSKKKMEYQKLLVLSLETGFVSFLVAATFIDRLYAEILYWHILFFSCIFSIFVLNERVE